MGVEGEAEQEPERHLELLAVEIGAEAEQELERDGLLDRLRAGGASLLRVPRWTADKVAELLDAALDRVYANPVEVRSAEEARARLGELSAGVEEGAGSTEQARRLAGILATAGPVLARLARAGGPVGRLARQGAKVLPSGRMVTVGTAAIVASVRIGSSVLTGTKELQILASYLLTRLHQAGLHADRDLVEQVVVQAYLNQDEPLHIEPGRRHDLPGLTRAWTARGIKAPSPAKQVQLDRKRVAAIERLNLPRLVAIWRSSRPVVTISTRPDTPDTPDASDTPDATLHRA